MNPFGIAKPEYLARPTQILRRLRHSIRPPSAEFVEARLPWGTIICVRPAEVQGSSILKLGLFDLVVTEMIWRLADPGDVACDVGANIGYMTAALLARVSPGGAVHSFEPHPELFAELTHNVEEWRPRLAETSVQTHQVALSSQPGQVILAIPDHFSQNRGLSSVVDATSVSPEPAAAMGDERVTHIQVEARTLDDIVAGQRVGLLKVDVEGHELAVLHGATRALDEGRVRDCVFEETRPYPTDVTEYLQQRSFRLFRVGKRVGGPVLIAPDAERGADSAWESCSYLATRDPDRAEARFGKPGWLCLHA